MEPADDLPHLLSPFVSQVPMYGTVASPPAVVNPSAVERPFFPVGTRSSDALLLAGSVLAVACWSVAGNACRVALVNALAGRQQFFTDYEYFGPNCIGCFVMGFIGAATSAARQDRLAPFAFRGLLVGFCGSLTTFSSWIVDMVNRPTAAGALAELICGVSIPFVFFHFGRDAMHGLQWLGDGLATVWRRRQGSSPETASGAPPSSSMSSSSSSWIWRANAASLIVFVVAAVVGPVGAFLVDRGIEPAKRRVSRFDLYAVVLAPAGAVPRYLLSLLLNNRERFRRVPVGTLVANLVAVFLAVLLNVIGRRPGESPHNGKLLALMGICGALSTVSTWVREICVYADQGRLPMAYSYGLVTLVPSVAIAVVGRVHNYV